MSDTPRTDERIIIHEYCELVSANFARGLERELNMAKAMIRQQQLLDHENQRLKERIKRLEEAADGMLPFCNPDYWREKWKQAKESA